MFLTMARNEENELCEFLSKELTNITNIIFDNNYIDEKLIKGINELIKENINHKEIDLI